MKAAVFWHRRDLRWKDNTGLYAALEGDYPVIPIFIFDKNILDDLADTDDARVSFIHHHVEKLDEFYRSKNSRLHCYYGNPAEIFKKLTAQYDLHAVYTNEDYEPYARQRDKEISTYLKESNIAFNTFRDHVLIHPDEVHKDDGKPYVVFTPYSRKWRNTLSSNHVEAHPSAGYFDNFYTGQAEALPALGEMGFTKNTQITFPSDEVSEELLKSYEERRNFPGIEGTSRLGIHLRFGTISIRDLFDSAKNLSSTYVNELIWREFYQMILWHFPRVVNENFHKKYDQLEWRNNEMEFERWCNGKTGYPIVDAGMNQLNATGYMHNRVRMIVASFLTKHLLIDWRWGEAYFARKLLDYELASNNGGWQWAAGTGTDAQPYFRIFNPYSQTEKFDKNRTYISRWTNADEKIEPIVEHSAARQRALETYKKAVG
jgi:deoxyribodipyrimidine photo-lyase